jgi:hypothetical protein
MVPRRTPCAAQGRERDEMTRRIMRFALLTALAALVSGCDKCGGFQEIQTPLRPNACKDAAAR